MESWSVGKLEKLKLVSWKVGKAKAKASRRNNDMLSRDLERVCQHLSSFVRTDS
ncbi:MAG: hypothetical protein JXQ26_05210 [Tissierellales bacterium]|nr:hypothetical protein [Tissierellales bacterium]MBN2827362.1 hypothetical protein [Tissierellales bacterium]